MGPRARARGNIATCGWWRVRRGLQWGHERALVEINRHNRNRSTTRGFNGATSARSWKSGHHVRHAARTLASMGPRARARGNRGGELRRPNMRLLQWGHERALVEMERACKRQ